MVDCKIKEKKSLSPTDDDMHKRLLCLGNSLHLTVVPLVELDINDVLQANARS